MSPVAWVPLVVAAAMLALAAPAPAQAASAEAPLFSRSGPGPGLAAPSSDVSQTLTLDRDALAALRGRASATLADFPLGAGASASMDLVRFEPFRPGARAVVVTASGEQEIPLPDARYFRGRVAGDPNSIVLLVADPDTARGFVATGGTVYRFGRDRVGVHRVWNLRDADPVLHPHRGEFCANGDPAIAASLVAPNSTVRRVGGPTSPSASREAASAVPSAADGEPGTSAPAYAPLLSLDVAIETDQELLSLFGGNTTGATTYLSDLAAAVSAIYLADVGVTIRFSSIRLWGITDPWTATEVGSLLGQLQNYWIAQESSVSRDTVHMVSGRSPLAYGGISYVNALCDGSYGYGVSTVYGSFNLLDPNDTYDAVVVAHELGHNFGSVHTHCYAPPLDQCYSGEGAGCYSGPESVPVGGGTIMSYCDLLPGGESNINLTFGPAVSEVIRQGAEGSACVTTPCGNGIVDQGEECDDGNHADGDCCSSSCTVEPDGSACNDGNQCTSGDACSAGLCAGANLPDGSACTDASRCTTDQCTSGACVSTASPAVSCKQPVDPGKAQLLIIDATPDRGDKVLWKWTKGAATAFSDFGAPDVADDYELCVFGANGSTLVMGRGADAGGLCSGKPCWKRNEGKNFVYVDRYRLPDGIDKIQLVAGTAGRAKIQVSGKAENLRIPSLASVTLPLRVQLVSANGGCWDSKFSVASKQTSTQIKANSD